MAALISFSFGGFECVSSNQNLCFSLSEDRSSCCAVLGHDGSVRDIFADALGAMKYIVSHPHYEHNAVRTALAGRMYDTTVPALFRVKVMFSSETGYEYELVCSSSDILSESLRAVKNSRTSLLFRREKDGSSCIVDFGYRYRGQRKIIGKSCAENETILKTAAGRGSESCLDMLGFISDNLVLSPDVNSDYESDFVLNALKSGNAPVNIILALFRELDIGNISAVELSNGQTFFVRRRGNVEYRTCFREESAVVRHVAVLGACLFYASGESSVVVIRDISSFLHKNQVLRVASLFKRCCAGNSQTLFTDTSSFLLRSGIVHPSLCVVATKNGGDVEYRSILDSFSGRRFIAKICDKYDNTGESV